MLTFGLLFLPLASNTSPETEVDKAHIKVTNLETLLNVDINIISKNYYTPVYLG